jgi:tetratricopeptide (TPR) repeat protein
MNAAPGPTATLSAAFAHAARLLEHDPALAARQARHVLATFGPHPPTQLLLAQADAARGSTSDALRQLVALGRTHPDWGAPLLELGLLHARAGRGPDAIACLREAVRRTPALPRAWLALGDHLMAIGDTAGADAAYTQHIRHATQDPRLMAAASALATNDLPTAERLLKSHLREAPTDVAAIRMLAELAARVGRLDDAAKLLDRCVELAPGFVAARQQYAMVLHRSGRSELALEQVEHVLREDPRHPSARNLRAVVLCRLGDFAAAIALYDDLLREYPDQARVWLSFGHALKTAGDQPRAIAAYRRGIALEPGSGEAWWSLANLKTFRFDDTDLEAMRRQLARTDLPDDERAQFDFALAKAHEDAGRHADAFIHYDRGNALRRKGQAYRAADTTRRIQRSIHVFDRAFLAGREGVGCAADDPIFVVGLPRAGSTLVEQILASHPEVEGVDELPEVIALSGELRRLAGDSPGATYFDVLATLPAARFRELGEQYLARTRIRRKTGRPRFIDKMPNNFLHAGLIHLMLPNARIVDVRRHPLACCFSGFKQYFARGQTFSYSLDDIGRYYRDYVALMAHFDDVLPGRVHRVVYERLVDDTEAEVRALLAHCGLAFDPACLRFFENDRPVRTASSEQVRQPIYRDGVDHWRHFEPWLGPLRAALGDVVDHYPDVPPQLVADVRATAT